MVTEDPIEVAWQEVLGAFDDEAAHKRFLALCASLDRLAEAGRRYREVKEQDPERAEQASAQIDRLLGLAMQNLGQLKTVPKPVNGRNVLLLIAVGVSGAIIVTALGLLLRFT